jgi:hypothetical protein
MLAVGAAPPPPQQQHQFAPPPPQQQQQFAPPQRPVSATPASGIPVSGLPMSGAPVSPGTAPYPVSGTFSTAMPHSPAAGSGPVNPQRPAGMGASMGTVPPPSPPRMGPPGGVQAPAAPPSYGVGVPVVVREHRRRTGPWIALVIVLAIIGGCLYGGNQLFGWMGDQFNSVKNGLPGFDGTGGPGNVDGLKAGEAIQLASDSAFGAVAGTGTVFTAQVNSGTTLIAAYPTTGSQSWTVPLQAEPAKLTMKIVGTLLIVDGEDDAKLGGDGKKDSRSVVDIATHQVKWTKEWDENDRHDLQYIGTDAIVEDGDWGKARVERVNLLDGTVKWSSPGDKDATGGGGTRDAKPSLHWPGKAPADLRAPTYTLTFSQLRPFQESLAPDAAVAVQLTGPKKAQTIDLNTGGAKSSGTIDMDGSDKSWLVYDDLAMFKPENDSTIVAYHVADWKLAWTYKAASGTTVDDLRPCGEKVVCVAAKQSGSKDAFIGIDTATGQAKWTNPSIRDRSGTISGTEEPNWYVMGDGKLVAGHGGYMTVGDAALIDPNTGKQQKVLGEGLSQQNVYAGYGNNLVVESVRKGTGQFAAFVVGLDGKIIGSADLRTLLQTVSVTNDTLVVLDEDQSKVYRFEIPGAK